jgi:ABC-type glycerol-3-phosphate transport system permease component
MGDRVTGILDQNEPAHEGLNFRQKIVVILMNVFLLAELTFSIYLGQKDQENMAAIFLTAFLPMVIVTLVLARVFVRKMGK